MKINISSVKLMPSKMKFGYAIYGEPSEELLKWAQFWNFQVEPCYSYTNFIPPPDHNPLDVFILNDKYAYMDGFSPNLNKHLHLGHLSNLILAKALQSLGVSDKYVAILGDTLDGDVAKQDALTKYKDYLKELEYHIDDIFYASEQTLSDTSILVDGTDEFEGTKSFKLSKHDIVGIKSNGATSYFYQDVALAQKLSAPTLYITGLEQKEHFENLKEMFPSTNHIGLGLVGVNHKKMGTRQGNVIMMTDIINELLPKFDNNLKLVFNILAGQILKYKTASAKNILMDQISDPKTSLGLYISYTMGRLNQAGIKLEPGTTFINNYLSVGFIKSYNNCEPHILFDALVEHCKKINELYVTHRIEGNEENHKMFSFLANDLILAASKLGLATISKV